MIFWFGNGFLWVDLGSVVVMFFGVFFGRFGVELG